MAAHAINASALTTAFNAFNEQSILLEASYSALKRRVDTLTAELRASQSARHRELLEKERLGERLQRMLETLPGAIVVLDAAGVISDCNSKALELLNRPLTGRPWAEVVCREFNAEHTAGGDLQLNDGRILSLARRRLQHEGGEILLLTDVTESRRMADMLARHQRLSAMGEMTARLAHQIRTPLAAALLYASQGAMAGGAAAGNNTKIVDRLKELDRMVADLLRFAAGARHEGETIDVSGLLEDVADTCTSSLGRPGALTIAVGNRNLRVAANRDALKGALTNLVSNASAACGDDACIEIGAIADDGRVCLTVADNGHGIAPDLLARVFEPFFTTRPQGTGLGLAVVRSVADAHGGEVLVDSGASGTTFAICLPAAASAAGNGEQHV